MDLIHAVILGIVEGITEFLPISSTGHLILASKLLDITQTEFVKTFEIAIQSGAILAVVFLYRRTFFPFIFPSDTSGTLDISGTYKRVLVAFIPTAIVGFVLYKLIKQYLIGNADVVLISLLIGGILLIAVELLFKRRTNRKSSIVNLKSELSYEKAFVVGLFQSIAVIPGVSRSASTIVGGMLLGISREQATEFSFLLAVPTMLAATALDLKSTSFSFNTNEWMALGVGFVVAFVVALASIKWLLNYVRTNTFIPFGIYRIALAILYFLLILR